MTTKTKAMSLADLNARAPSDEGFTFEYILPDNTASGVTFTVLGANSKVVDDAINESINAGRRRAAALAADAKPGRPLDITPIESDIADNQRLTAIRLIGWSLSDPCTPENALELVRTNPHAAQQIVERSNNLANFLRRRG